MTKHCLSCRTPHLRPLLDFGPVPLTNRFSASAAASTERVSLKLGQCGRCGLVQQIGPPPADVLRARVPWIAYQEPEAHLDDVVERLLKLPDMGSRSVAVGLSTKDDTTLRRLRSRGMSNVWRIDAAADLGATEPCAGIESIPERLDVDVASRLTADAGQADLVVARHVLEHVADLPRFFAAVKRLVRPGGYVVWEVPDCTRSLELGDYSMPWEEHVAYFTPATLRLTLEAAGFEVMSLLDYPYARENSLVAACRVGTVGQLAAVASELLIVEVRRAVAYADGFAAQQAQCEAYLAGIAKAGGKVAVFGAGHASIMHLHLLRLAPYVDCFLDDDPNKQGLNVPGTPIPIVPSTELATRGVRLCLLGIGPDAARRVIERRKDFAAQGGTFASIFPTDARSLASIAAG
jgi:SAM-dependent methyltransferase